MSLRQRDVPLTITSGWGGGRVGIAATSSVPVVHPIVRSLAADGPMLPTLVDGLPDRAGWVFEPKWEGWRCLAVVDDGRVDLDPEEHGRAIEVVVDRREGAASPGACSGLIG